MQAHSHCDFEGHSPPAITPSTSCKVHTALSGQQLLDTVASTSGHETWSQGCWHKCSGGKTNLDGARDVRQRFDAFGCNKQVVFQTNACSSDKHRNNLNTIPTQSASVQVLYTQYTQERGETGQQGASTYSGTRRDRAVGRVRAPPKSKYSSTVVLLKKCLVRLCAMAGSNNLRMK